VVSLQKLLSGNARLRTSGAQGGRFDTRMIRQRQGRPGALPLHDNVVSFSNRPEAQRLKRAKHTALGSVNWKLGHLPEPRPRQR
jgi:hypothetical protein